MMADLCIHFPVVRRLFDTADRLARDVGDQVPPSEYLFAPAVSTTKSCGPRQPR